VPPATSPAPPPAALRASYQVRFNGDGMGYRAEVEIRNPGMVAVSGWQVVVTLPAGQEVAKASSGVAFSPSTGDVGFTPVDAGTSEVKAGGSVKFAFEVPTGDTGPTGCAIDGQPCN
jgi:hypothetical protein